MKGFGGHTIGHITGLNILKLQLIQLLEAVVSSQTSSQTHSVCYREQPPTPSSPTPLTTKPKQSPVQFKVQLAINFLCKKNCGSMNIASWLA